MGMFDSFKANLAGNKALRAHASAQQLGQRGEDEKMDVQYKLAKHCIARRWMPAARCRRYFCPTRYC